MNDRPPTLAPFTSSIPRLTTPRLLLREFRAEDFPAYAENSADPAATEFLSGAIDRRAAWRIFASGAGAWVIHGAGWWALEVRETGEVVGNVGAFLRETCPDFEVGWTLYRRFWGQGYGTEGAKAALAFTFESHRAKRVIAHIKGANTASVAVSQRLGMKYETDVDFFGETVGRYSISS